MFYQCFTSLSDIEWTYFVGILEKVDNRGLERNANSFIKAHWYQTRNMLRDAQETLKGTSRVLKNFKLVKKYAKPPFFVTNSRLWCQCWNFAEKDCLLSQFHFTSCRYFLGLVKGPRKRMSHSQKLSVQWLWTVNAYFLISSAIWFYNSTHWYIAQIWSKNSQGT